MPNATPSHALRKNVGKVPLPVLSRNGEKSGRQFEPEAGACIDRGFAGAPSQIASHDAQFRLEGWEVVEAWAGLPGPLRAAILALVRSTRKEARR